MCGIAGIIDLKDIRDIDQRALNRMMDRLEHRGPDGHGIHAEPGFGFGHRRLAIIDLDGGKQPFTSSVGKTVITFNGEIYNHRILAREISSEGRVLKTQSDTEVLAELIDIRGVEALRSLNGMFAFASYSPRTDTFMLARDRLGEKPLYYAESRDGFLVFASEIDALLASGMIPAEIDEESIAAYMMYGYVPDPKSIYRGIHKLPPGHYLTVQHRDPLPAPRAWWSAPMAPDNSMSYQDAVDGLMPLLDRAVSDQMIADVPIAGFLSGGVDSSAIVGAMASQAIDPVKTCAIGFDDPAHDERSYAQQIAQLYNTDHHTEVVAVDSARLLPVVASVYGEPFADSSALPTLILCAMARRHATVALSGDGGDEVFAGYSRYFGNAREARLRSVLPAPFRRHLIGPVGNRWPRGNWVPPQLRLRSALQAASEDGGAGYARAVSAVLPDTVNDVLDSRLRHLNPTQIVRDAVAQSNTDDPVLQAQAADMATWLPGRMLVKVDRASMASSLEVRPPFLDHRLVEWAATLPRDFKMKGDLGKRVLKEALEPELPESILYRQKQGFGAPVDRWFRDSSGSLMPHLRKNTAWKDCGYFDVDRVLNLAENHEKNKENNGQALWSVLMFDAFLTRTPFSQAALQEAVNAPQTSSDTGIMP